MKCQNKKKNVKRAVAGIIFLSVIAIILSAYGVTQMYASPEKKALKTMLKSGELLQSTVEKYINNIDVSANNYTGKLIYRSWYMIMLIICRVRIVQNIPLQLISIIME